LREATRQADQLEHQLENLHKQKQEWEQTGGPRLAELTIALEAKAFAQEARARLDQIDQELAALGYDLEAHEKLRQAENAGRQAEEDLRKLEGARAALAPIEREIAGLAAQLADLEKNLAAMTAAYDEAWSIMLLQKPIYLTWHRLNQIYMTSRSRKTGCTGMSVQRCKM
jgi:DNA repair exonuclease SbcCD ATPase subunit